MITALFYFSLLMVFYAYIGYPLMISLVGLICFRRVAKAEIQPKVSILISAFNEAKVIGQTLQNKLELDYPSDKLEIIVVSDCSTDSTDEIVKAEAERGVKLIRQTPRSGKTSALNRAAEQASGDILVFSDANSIWVPEALSRLIANFADPHVGYVTGKMIYSNPDGNAVGDGCTAYMRYENFLRSAETRAGSVVGVDGGIDAVRKMLYQPMNPDQLPDFVLPLKVIEKGYRVVYESGAIMKEAALKDVSDEYRMRVRVALRAFWALLDMRHLLSVRKYKLYAVQLWSHKVLRYLCIMLLITIYLTNMGLVAKGSFFKLFFVVQNTGYIAAVLSPVLEKRNIHNSLLRLCHYFVLINLASAHAFIKFLLGKKQVVWTPRKG